MTETTAPSEGPGVERTITLTDAVVAIAMTLLILPLVDVVGDAGVESLSALWAAHGQLLQSFVISFLVIYAFWRLHGSIYHRLVVAGRSDVRWLSVCTMGWLLVIAFLPFPTAMIGRQLTPVTGPLYLGTMLLLSTLTLVMTVLVHRAVGLPLGLAWVSTAVFAVCLLVSFFSPQLGLYLLLLLVVTGRIEGVHTRRAMRNRAT
jgi:uncharacterized membrane protein